MNYVDVIILVALVIGFALGYKDGIIRKLIGLVGLILAVLFAYMFSDSLGVILAPYFNDDASLARIIAALLIFFGTLAVVSVIKRIVHPADKVNKFVNQFLGGLFGATQMAFFLSGFLLFFHIFNLPPENIREHSKLYKPIYSVIPTTIDLLTGENNTEELFNEFLKKFEQAEETTEV